MSVTTRARNAYQQSTQSTATPRAVEYKLLSRLTGALVAGENNKKTDLPAYIDALSRNLEFWTVIGADTAHRNNALPPALRAQIFYLYEFVRSHTNKLYNSNDGLTAEALIDINKNIMMGLRHDPAPNATADL